MIFQDVPHGLIAYDLPSMLQGAGHAIIAPGAMFLCQTYDQGFLRLLDLGATESLARFGAITLLRHELPVPGKHDVRLDAAGHLLQRFLAQPLVPLGERLQLPIAAPHTALDLFAEASVFCH